MIRHHGHSNGLGRNQTFSRWFRGSVRGHSRLRSWYFRAGFDRRVLEVVVESGTSEGCVAEPIPVLKRTFQELDDRMVGPSEEPPEPAEDQRREWLRAEGHRRRRREATPVANRQARPPAPGTTVEALVSPAPIEPPATSF